MGHIQIWRHSCFDQQMLKYLMTFKIDVLQFYNQSES